MEELQLISRQRPGEVVIDNFLEMKDALAQVLARYENVVYTEDMLSDAKADKKELTRLRREIDDRRKEVKKAYLAPYNEFEAQVKELLAMVDAPLDEIKGFVSEMDQREKDAKRSEIWAYYSKQAAPLGDLAQAVFDSPAFFDSKWLNKTTRTKTWQEAVDQKIFETARNLRSIKATGGARTDVLLAKYLERLDLDDVLHYQDAINAVSQISEPLETNLPTRETEDRRTGYKVLRLTGTVDEITQVMELLALAGVDVEELEDGMPQPMPERTQPDFDSFVAFDSETTGTFGAAAGDSPAEITEIGAVKVVNGQIVDRFSQLANPGRKIVPRIARITHITDEMVAGEPDVSTVIRQFAEFVEDAVLVGHNIKSSDLYYISRAAQRAGVRLENPFFDTYRYAKQFKARQGWEKLNLEYLSEQFGISQPDAHRAWCDAEANVGVYWKLRDL